ISAKKIGVQNQRQYSERHNRKHGESALHPQQFTIERHQLLKILFPSETIRYLKAGGQYCEMSCRGKPQVQIEKSFGSCNGHNAPIASMKGSITLFTNGR